MDPTTKNSDSGRTEKKRWIGTKSGSGVWQRIISEMPPHDVYLEPFAGTGKIGITKKQARSTIFIDSDPAAPIFMAIPPEASPNPSMRSRTAIVGDAISWILSLKPMITDRWLLYVDPPYLMTVRSTKQRYYKNEFHTDAQHKQLLSLLLTLPAGIIISGYDSELYNEMLSGWRKIYIPTVKRSGARAIEVLWMNFPECIAYHDIRYVGKNYRERERVKRKKIRWMNRLKNMDRIDKAVLIDAIGDMINKKPGE